MAGQAQHEGNSGRWTMDGRRQSNGIWRRATSSWWAAGRGQRMAESELRPLGASGSLWKLLAISWELSGSFWEPLAASGSLWQPAEKTRTCLYMSPSQTLVVYPAGTPSSPLLYFSLASHAGCTFSSCPVVASVYFTGMWYLLQWHDR